MRGCHKITITAEIDGGAGVFTQTQEFNSGNPIFHASAFITALQAPVGRIKKAIEAIYGIKPDERDSLSRVKFADLAHRFEQAKSNGAKVYRIVIITENRTTYYSEALYLHQLEKEMENISGVVEYSVEYGVPTGDVFSYHWKAL